MAASRSQPGRRTRGFTLIEVLIVVLLLGILAGIVIPQFRNATQESKDATLKDCLRYLRTQVTIYKAQHNDVAPGYPSDNVTNTPDSGTFISQMTQYSDAQGNLTPTQNEAYPFGPYLSVMPNNPLTSQNAVWIVTGQGMPSPDASKPCGWIYNAQTQQLVANIVGADQSGVPYSNY